MSRYYLFFVSAFAALTAAIFIVMLQSATIPTVSEDGTDGAVERDRAALDGSWWVRTLVDDDVRSYAASDSPSASYTQMRLANRARRAKTTVTVATVLAAIALLAGLLGIVRALTARPGRSFLLVAAIVLLTIDVGGALLLGGSSRSLGQMLVLFILCEAFALFVAANLLPVPSHPWVAKLENDLARLPRAARRSRLAFKIVVGTALFALGAGASLVASFALPGLTVAFSGLILVGLVTAGTSVAVATRGLVGAR